MGIGTKLPRTWFTLRDDLLPQTKNCPWCGDKSRVYFSGAVMREESGHYWNDPDEPGGSQVRCEQCGARGPEVWAEGPRDSELTWDVTEMKKAVALWNSLPRKEE